MLLYFSLYRRHENRNQKSCHTGNSCHASSVCNTTVSIAEYNLWPNSRKTGIDLLYVKIWSEMEVNYFVLGCKNSKPAIFKYRSTGFCSFFENPHSSQKRPLGWLLCSLPTYNLYVHSHFIPSFFIFYSGLYLNPIVHPLSSGTLALLAVISPLSDKTWFYASSQLPLA